MRWPALLLLALPFAQAHQPTAGGETALVIEDPYISYAYNATFVSGEELFRVELTYDRGFSLPFELLVEDRPENEGFRPMYAVVGPGLPTPSAEELDLLPEALPEGAGAYVDLNDDDPRGSIFEGVMRRVYLTTGPVALLLQPGEVEVWIWSPDGDLGDVVLGFGVEEDFSGGFGGLFADWSIYAY